MRKLIWTCNEGHCGGYADRLKGIVTAYLMAKHLGREFCIEWNGITNLQDAFYVPCGFYTKQAQGVQRLRLIDVLETGKQVSTAIEGLSEIKAETVYLSVNQYDQAHWLFLGGPGKSMPSNFARVLNRLMTPNAAVTTHPEYLKACEFLESQRTVGVQVRTGAYHDEPGVNQINPREVWERVVVQDNARAVFIASDSPPWKTGFAALHTPVYQIPFDPAHIERSDPDAIRRTFLLTVIEHQILSKCSKVYTGWGGFGRTAAWWGRKPCVDLLLPPAESEGRVVDIGS